MFDGQIMGERLPIETDEKELGLLMAGVTEGTGGVVVRLRITPEGRFTGNHHVLIEKRLLSRDVSLNEDNEIELENESWTNHQHLDGSTEG